MTRPPTRVLLGVVLTLALLAAVVVGVLRLRGDDTGRVDETEAELGSLAEEAALAFFSLDHRTLDEDRDRLFDLTTSSFEESYEEQSEALREQVGAKEMVLTSSVPEAGTALESRSDDEASVLVAVDVRTEAAGGASGDERYRTRVHLVPVGDSWQVDRIQQVSAAADAVEDADPVHDGLTDDTAGAVEAAAEGLPLALSYDYRDLDAGLQAATATMTEEFGTEFERTFADSAAELATRKQAVTSATVAGAGLVRADDEDHALCLVFVDQALVSSTTLGDPERPVQVSQNRVLVEVVRVDGDWLVDSIQPF